MYEYKVIEAPTSVSRGWFSRKKANYAQTLTEVINKMALDSWEYQQTETGPEKSSPGLLVFRRRIAKADEGMAEPKSFADRMDEAEHRHDAGRTYHGPIRPRRARIVAGDDGPITERPKALAVSTPEAQVIDGTARRVTPMKPNAAAAY